MTDFSDLSFSDLVLELFAGKIAVWYFRTMGRSMAASVFMAWWAEAAGSADPADRAVFSSLYQFYPCI